jgi:hypothetical protein
VQIGTVNTNWIIQYTHVYSTYINIIDTLCEYDLVHMWFQNLSAKIHSDTEHIYGSLALLVYQWLVLTREKRSSTALSHQLKLIEI